MARVYVTNESRFLSYLSLLEKQYNALLESVHRLKGLKFQGSDLSDVVNSFPDSKHFVRDVKALQPDSTEYAKARLQQRTIDYIKSAQSYGNVRKNVIGQKLIAMLTYIDTIKDVFEVDTEKADKLKLAISKAVINSGCNPHYFIEDGHPYEELFDRAERDVIRENQTARASHQHVDF